ncbi:glycerate kinase [Haloglycomyces albus]|uniref:glycerate kinase n=1 Tax=Haloglycomyces albus TaxID=526067 RepID=UPI00046CF47F|nr:glycerate kinase [Haloglycomyces albus]
MNRILLAPDKFKGSLTASQVAARLGRGIRRVDPDREITELPVADGGDGTVDAAVAAGFDRREHTVTGPLGDPVTATVAVRGTTAVIEMAQASGLARSREPYRPMEATSRGTGELLRLVRDAGATDIILGVGGSACTDGGAGLIHALGVKLHDEEGKDIGLGGGELHRIASIDATSTVAEWKNVSITLASDVTNPLLGPTGAATVFGPQKGADDSAIVALEAGLRHYARKVAEYLGVDLSDRKGTGAAGGVGFAAQTFLGARAVSGIDLLLDLVGFTSRLPGTGLVITGEGRLDDQTLHGKAPMGVAQAARASNVPVYAVCGINDLDAAEAEKAGLEAVFPLTELEPDPDRSIATAGPLLERLGENIATYLIEKEKP